MKWSDVKPDAQPTPLREAVSAMDALSFVRIRMNISVGVRLYIAPSCRAAVLSHVRSDIREVGGLLLGRVWQSDGDRDPIVVIEDSLASEMFSNSAVSLEMGTEIWSRASQRTVNGVMVVGWYHSHPNLGAFFSGTDRRTQAAFFQQPYSVGWVIDPFRREERVFMGAESEEYLPPLEDLTPVIEEPGRDSLAGAGERQHAPQPIQD